MENLNGFPRTHCPFNNPIDRYNIFLLANFIHAAERKPRKQSPLQSISFITQLHVS